MVIKHNFHLFFGVIYLLLLPAGMAAALALNHFTGVEEGNLMAVLCFAAATQLSVTRFDNRFVFIDGPSSVSIAETIARRRYALPLCYALIGVSIDMVFYTLVSLYFRGEFTPLDVWRLPVMVLVYGVIAWLVLSFVEKGKMSHG